MKQTGFGFPESQRPPGAQEHPMRKPCTRCMATQGFIIRKSNQDCVYCDNCGAFQYNAPRNETER